MDTARVRNAFGGLVEDLQVVTAQRNELAVSLHDVLAVVDHDETYLRTVAHPGEPLPDCATRILREARASLTRNR